MIMKKVFQPRDKMFSTFLNNYLKIMKGYFYNYTICIFTQGEETINSAEVTITPILVLAPRKLLSTPSVYRRGMQESIN